MGAVRIAVAGVGAIGLRHVEELRQCVDTALCAVVDPGPAAAAVASREAVPLYRSLDALLGVMTPDGVILATPNHLHVEQALACIEARVPVLVEKPLAHTLDEGRRLVDIAEREGAVLLVGHHRAHSAILRHAVDVVKSGQLGRIVGVIGSAVFCKPDSYYEGASAWRREAGGGPVLINMIHEVGNLRALVGEILAVQAFASSATREFAVEDTVAINLRFENGALGTFLLSDTAASPKSWEQTSRENAAYPTYPEEDAYVVLGSDGSLGIPTMRLHRYATPSDRSWLNPFETTTLRLERTDPLATQIEHFAAVIRGEQQPLVTGRDGLQNLRVVDAILEAARTHAAVDLPVHRRGRSEVATTLLRSA